MVITTKYDRGQEVFVEFGKQLLAATIKSIEIKVTKAEGSNDVVIKTMYGIYVGNGQSATGEDYIHESPLHYNEVVAVRKADKIKRLEAKIKELQES